MKRTKVTYTDENGKTTFIKPDTKSKQDYPFFQVNHNDNTEVLRDGEVFAKTASHLDSIRVVMALQTIYKQMRKPVISLTEKEIDHILVSMHCGCQHLHTANIHPTDNHCDIIKLKLKNLKKELEQRKEEIL